MFIFTNTNYIVVMVIIIMYKMQSCKLQTQNAMSICPDRYAGQLNIKTMTHEQTLTSTIVWYYNF